MPEPRRDLRSLMAAASGRPPPPPRPRRRLGCLTSIVGVLALGLLMEWGLNALLAPYNFTMGGHFHWYPGWQGVARVHTATSGGDYVMWIRFDPTTPGYRKSPLKGYLTLCTPRGERLQLNMGGLMVRKPDRNLDGVPLHLYAFNYTARAQFSGKTRPHVDFWGAFGDRTLAVDDHASIAHAFNADGTVNDGHWKSPRDERVQLVFHEGSPWTLRPSCTEMFKDVPAGR